MSKRFVCMGECLATLTAAADGRYDLGQGGDACATALQARRALPDDWDVEIVATLGTDQHSMRLVDAIDRAGVKTNSIRLAEGRRCGLMVTDASGAQTIWRDGAASRHLADDAEWLTPALAGATMVFFSGVALGILPPKPRGRMLRAIVAARDGGAQVAFAANSGPNLWLKPGAEAAVLNAGATVADIVLADATSHAPVFGDVTAEAAAGHFVADGVAEAVVVGGNGIALAQPGWETTVARRVTFGPAFWAGYLGRRLLGEAPERAAAR